MSTPRYFKDSRDFVIPQLQIIGNEYCCKTKAKMRQKGIKYYYELLEHQNVIINYLNQQIKKKKQ